MDAQIIRTFEEPVSAPDGQAFVAKIAGRHTPEGRWEAWVEFVPEGGSPVLRSGRETTQADLRNLERWAEGLTRVYLEGSLDRTLKRQEVPERAMPAEPREEPRFEGPGPELRAGVRPPPDDVALNPIVHYRQGEADLRRRVSQLASSELRAVALAYHFDDGGAIDLDTLDRDSLEELIVVGARTRAL